MAIDVVVEEVADNLEEIAQATRRINTSAVGYCVGGLIVGAAIGFYFGHRWKREKLRAEAFKESEEEVEKIRELYREGTTVVSTPKPSIDEVLEGTGYSSDKVAELRRERPLVPPVPVSESYVSKRPYTSEKPKIEVKEEWDYALEIAERKQNPDDPYVINMNERGETEGEEYSSVTYTYYAGDDVLVDEDDHPLPHADIIVGRDNLKFGHGTDDPNVVFVRNEHLKIEMEICRTPQSYEEEVLGLERDNEN